MVKRLRDFENWTVVGSDRQDIGPVKDFYVDDERWVVRYLLTDAGGWLATNPVLVSPVAIDRLDWENSRIHVDLTRDQVGSAPQLSTDSRIDRDYEAAYFGYYGYPQYWVGPHAWGLGPMPARVAAAAPGVEPVKASDFGGDGHLRGVNDVSGHHIQALDGELGHVEDFLIDTESWSVRYLVIDTSNWIGGKTVVVAPEWVRRVDWKDRLIHIDLTREGIKESPEYDPTVEMTREYEDRLYRYYRRPVYWE